MSKESHYREVMMTGRTWNTIAKAIGLVSVAALSFGALAACGNTTAVDSSKGRVYYLNKKAEEQEKWEALAQAFQDETGIETQIQLSATDYDQTLRSEMAKDEAPTMFQADGPSFMYSWLDYAADMSDSKIYGELTDSYKDRTLKNADGKPVGIPVRGGKLRHHLQQVAAQEVFRCIVVIGQVHRRSQQLQGAQDRRR